MCPNKEIKLTRKIARKLIKHCLTAVAEGVMAGAGNVVGRVRKIEGSSKKKRSITTYDLFYDRHDHEVLLKVEYDTPTDLSVQEQRFCSMADFARAYGVASVNIPRRAVYTPECGNG